MMACGEVTLGALMGTEEASIGEGRSVDIYGGSRQEKKGWRELWDTREKGS